MAFQNSSSFLSFLQSTTASSELSKRAASENWILDERTSPAREDDFLDHSGFITAAPREVGEWFSGLRSYSLDRLALSDPCDTFTHTNKDAWLSLEADWTVVRLETLSGLCSRARVMLTEEEVHELIRELLAERASRTSMDIFRKESLLQWLHNLNEGSDERPVFVAPFADVETLLKREDWADRLRDALGLGHIHGQADRPTPVVLMRYNLERVTEGLPDGQGWAASPTVLDEVAQAGPNPCFFPAPFKASAKGYGFTVDLGTDKVASLYSEFLHRRIRYTLEDFDRLGEVCTKAGIFQIMAARQRHLKMLEDDLIHLKDLP